MAESRARLRLAADVGGTFIDFVAVDAGTGEVRFDKQPASSGALVAEFMTALDRMGIGGAEIEQLFHGTTVAINAVVQERGARVALVTTAGFRGRAGAGPRRSAVRVRLALRAASAAGPEGAALRGAGANAPDR